MPRSHWRLLVLLPLADARADDLVDAAIRADMLKRADGRVAHIETEYNDIFITKRRHELTMSFQLKGYDYTESIANLHDPDDLPVRYTQVMTVGVLYPPEPKTRADDRPRRRLDLELSRPLHARRRDRHRGSRPRRDQAAKRYFGMKETPRVRYLEGDGRVFLNRHKETYDLILVDAFHGGYVPFHLLTREFYTLVKQRLAPGGAAAFNVHDGTKLYASTLLTCARCFPACTSIRPARARSITVVTAERRAGPGDARAARRPRCRRNSASAFALPDLLARRTERADTTQNGRIAHRRFRAGEPLRHDRRQSGRRSSRAQSSEMFCDLMTFDQRSCSCWMKRAKAGSPPGRITV